MGYTWEKTYLVVFDSSQYTLAKKNYSVYKQKMFAIVKTLKKQCFHLFEVQFLVYRPLYSQILQEPKKLIILSNLLGLILQHNMTLTSNISRAQTIQLQTCYLDIQNIHLFQRLQTDQHLSVEQSQQQLFSNQRQTWLFSRRL